ncbi:MAG: DUF3540 domain-containing protein [Deltaproteobacteria bacterium]|jgi:hypothetical protein|nr:DUF3540 domain-containing protein [Deltaproteobacteria bacterium]
MPTNILEFSPGKETQGFIKAKVLEATPGDALVLSGQRLLRAELSRSLLLSPTPGDTVLVHEDQDGAFLLSVLKRENAEALGVLRLPKKSALSLSELTLNAPKLEVMATETSVRSSSLSLEGAVMSVRFSVLGQIVSRIHTFAKNILSRSKDMELRAERANIEADNINLTASEDFRARARHMDLLAKGAFKVDGRIIKLG